MPTMFGVHWPVALPPWHSSCRQIREHGRRGKSFVANGRQEKPSQESENNPDREKGPDKEKSGESEKKSDQQSKKQPEKPPLYKRRGFIPTAIIIAVFAEVALDYLLLRGTQERLAIARNNLSAAKEILELTVSRRKTGLASDLDVTQAAAQMSITSAVIPPLQAQLRQMIHALSILLAREPNALSGELEKIQPLPITPPIVPVGLPSQLLERRPDIRAAERQMAAATADIGVAEADLFPKFALNGGSMGLDSSTPGSLFDASSTYFLVSPTVTWRIFDAGRIFNIKTQKASQQEAVIQYRNTILTALQDVEDALTLYANEQNRRAELKEAVNQSQESLALAQQQYQHGLSSFLTVLTAEQTLFSAQDNLAQSDQTVSTDLVALYKSLGGGW